ncbi:hypothetical protein BX600DRAFT_229607 [Xylariales sp. PMI_506]|nr:hypothetical protein BX600DRAFT_229607 [Xylariales sp. PMI_506]
MASQYPLALLGHWTSVPSQQFLASNDNDVKDWNQDDSISLPALIAAFVPSVFTSTIFMLIFIVLRKPFRRIYSPRTYIDVIPEKDRTPSSSVARLGWIEAFVRLDDKFVLEHSSLDGYLFLRFLRNIILICIIGICITWVVLFPVNATGGGQASQLDRLGFGNVRDQSKLWAHAAVAWVFYGLVMFIVMRERLWLIGLRQAWYLSKANASRLSSRTVLYLEPSRDISLDADAQSNFGPEARRQWAVKATPKLDSLVGARDSKATNLESLETSFLTNAHKKQVKFARQQEQEVTSLPRDTVDRIRPKHRKYWVAGHKTDAIDRTRDELQQASTKLDEIRDTYSASTPDSHAVSAIFVEYASQKAAHQAYHRSSSSGIPIPASVLVQSRLLGVLPKEIVWKNLTRPNAVRLSGKFTANLIIAAFILFWSIISAFIGSISNVIFLSKNVEWLHWIADLPQPLLGLLTGLLPPLATSLLSSYVPIIMRYVAKLFGEPTTVTAELQVQTWYYLFQVIQIFFVTALSSSAIDFIPQIIQDPQQVPLILAQSLPKSSNFYLTYFVLQGLTSSAKNIVNFSDLFQDIFLDLFVSKTPRQKYQQYTNLKNMSWGKLHPKYANFAIIALAYACISPLVLGPATIGLVLFYACYRHNLLFVAQPKLETKGRCYTRSLAQLLTGVYVGELALIGLFSLRGATGPSIATVVLLVCTIVYNVVTNRYLNPLEDRLPEELFEREDEEEPLLQAAEEGAALQEAHDRSRVQRLGHSLHLPQDVVDPIARFFEPHIYASHKVMKGFLKGSDEDSGPPQYSEEELDRAYANPALTSGAQVWIPADEVGLSREEVEANAAAGITSTDYGAWIDKKGRVQFDRQNLRDLPLWQQSVVY